MVFDAISILQLSTSAVLLSLFGVLWYRQYRRRQREARRLARVHDDEPLTAPDRDLLFAKRQLILDTLSEDTDALLSGRLQVRHIMSPGTYRVSPQVSADEVARIMRERCIHHLMVCEHDVRLVGVVNARDLMRSDGETAAEIMTTSPPTIEPDALISPAVTLLIKQQIACLPVVEGGRVCGLVSATDIMMAFQCVLQTMQRRAAEVPAQRRELIESGV
ncbi:MAG: CBS domain-containing protein [Pirellulaceae bacterium]